MTGKLLIHRVSRKLNKLNKLTNYAGSQFPLALRVGPRTRWLVGWG
jgi:hypothetical protein